MILLMTLQVRIRLYLRLRLLEKVFQIVKRVDSDWGKMHSDLVWIKNN